MLTLRLSHIAPRSPLVVYIRFMMLLKHFCAKLLLFVHSPWTLSLYCKERFSVIFCSNRIRWSCCCSFKAAGPTLLPHPLLWAWRPATAAAESMAAHSCVVTQNMAASRIASIYWTLYCARERVGRDHASAHTYVVRFHWRAAVTGANETRSLAVSEQKDA